MTRHKARQELKKLVYGPNASAIPNYVFEILKRVLAGANDYRVPGAPGHFQDKRSSR